MSDLWVRENLDAAGSEILERIQAMQSSEVGAAGAVTSDDATALIEAGQALAGQANRLDSRQRLALARKLLGRHFAFGIDTAVGEGRLDSLSFVARPCSTRPLGAVVDFEVKFEVTPRPVKALRVVVK